jgi:PAS domain S-box-containing protein
MELPLQDAVLEEMQAAQPSESPCDELERRVQQRATEVWQATFDAIRDPVMILDRQYRIVRANTATLALLDAPREAVLGRSCHTLMHGTGGPVEGCPFARALETKKHEESELFHPQRNAWLLVSADPLLDEGGEITGVVHSIKDITERKRAEQTVRMLAGQLLTAQEAERRRVAREMHDDLTQRLAGLAIEAAKLERECGPSAVADRLRAMKDDLIRLSQDMHSLSRQLHPSILEDLGLVEALRSECGNFSQREGIRVRYAPQAVPPEIPKEVALCLYRIAQEALRNVAKHSGAQEAHVSLTATDEGILLSIEDAGAGFSPVQVQGKPGLGLASMEERARLIGGDFSLRSRPSQGTLIEVWAPLPGRTP